MGHKGVNPLQMLPQPMLHTCTKTKPRRSVATAAYTVAAMGNQKPKGSNLIGPKPLLGPLAGSRSQTKLQLYMLQLLPPAQPAASAKH
jgi:hypothetical protein